jgi:hypothetical protein
MPGERGVLAPPPKRKSPSSSLGWHATVDGRITVRGWPVKPMKASSSLVVYPIFEN